MHTATAEPVPETARCDRTSDRRSGPRARRMPRAEAPTAPLSGLTIAVDPGHNGDNGANPDTISDSVPDGRGGTEGLQHRRHGVQQTGTRSTASHGKRQQVLEDALEDAGASVVLSRSDDDGVGPCVDERGTFADDADALVSLHANGTEDDSATRFPRHRRPGGRPCRRRCRGRVRGPRHRPRSRARGRGAQHAIPRTTTWSCGTTSRRSTMLRVPAVMLEAGEMRNAEDAQMLRVRRGAEADRRSIVDALTIALVD